MTPNDLPHHITQYLKHTERNSAWLARKAGVDPSLMRKIINRERVATKAAADKIYQAMGVEL